MGLNKDNNLEVQLEIFKACSFSMLRPQRISQPQGLWSTMRHASRKRGKISFKPPQWQSFIPPKSLKTSLQRVLIWLEELDLLKSMDWRNFSEIVKLEKFMKELLIFNYKQLRR